MSGNKRRRGIVLQDRDRRLLSELSVMRVIDRTQAQLIAGFGTQQGASFRMLGLTEAGLILRYNIGTAAGGRKWLYLLTPIGAKAVGVPNRSPRRKSGATVAVDIFARHQLAVNDIHCALKYKNIPVEGIRFVRWLSFFDSVAPGIPLVPDGYVELGAPVGIIAAFLEVDFDTEGLAVWRAKIRNYLTLAKSGEFEKRFQQSRFRVLSCREFRAPHAIHSEAHRDDDRQDLLVFHIGCLTERFLGGCVASSARQRTEVLYIGIHYEALPTMQPNHLRRTAFL